MHLRRMIIALPVRLVLAKLDRPIQDPLVSSAEQGREQMLILTMPVI